MFKKSVQVQNPSVCRRVHEANKVQELELFETVVCIEAVPAQVPQLIMSCTIYTSVNADSPLIISDRSH